MTTARPTHRGPALTEAIDPVTGTVRVRGSLTPQGADLLRGTVENLRRLGHSRVVVDLSGVQDADEQTRRVLLDLLDGLGNAVVLVGAG